jgi:site-specific recombinase
MGARRVKDTPEQRARDLIVFADAFEDAGHPQLARRSRVVAADLLRIVGELRDEQSARRAIQADRDRALQILANHAAENLDPRLRREGEACVA